MTRLHQIEINTIGSFNLVKADIMSLQDEMATLKLHLAQVYEQLADVRVQVAKKRQRKVTQRVTKTKFIASRTSTKVHQTACPFAKNIKPRNKRVFASKNTALHEGLKPCSCVG